MAPKPGNAFAQQQEAERVKQLRSQSETTPTLAEVSMSDPESGGQAKSSAALADDDVKTTTLVVPPAHGDNPSTGGTTMDAITGPMTDREKYGRQMVREQREEMEAKLERGRHRKSRSADSLSTVKHPSALVAPLQPHSKSRLAQFKDLKDRLFKKSERIEAASPALNKPLPAISTPEAAYARATGMWFPGEYIPSPPSIASGGPIQGSPSPFGKRDVTPLDPGAQSLYPDQYTASQALSGEQGSSLPDPRSATGRFSAQTYETNPSRYLGNGNQGMIFSNHLLTPTRAGDFATFGQPRVVHPPSMMSMAASFVDAQSPTVATTSQRPTVLGVVPEVQETRELQAALASDTEKLYNQHAQDSQSDTPLRVRSTSDESIAATPGLGHSRSLPSMVVSSAAAVAAVPTLTTARRASTGASMLCDRPTTSSFANAAEPSPASPHSPANIGAMLKQFYAQSREDLRTVHTNLSCGMEANRRVIEATLGALQAQIKELELFDTLRFLEGKSHATDAKSDRIQDKVDAIKDKVDVIEKKLDVLLGALGSGEVMRGSGRVRGGGVGAGVGARLGQPGPHVPWGGRGSWMREREREVSAGLGRGVDAWYWEARRA